MYNLFWMELHPPEDEGMSLGVILDPVLPFDAQVVEVAQSALYQIHGTILTRGLGQPREGVGFGFGYPTPVPRLRSSNLGQMVCLDLCPQYGRCRSK